MFSAGRVRLRIAAAAGGDSRHSALGGHCIGLLFGCRRMRFLGSRERDFTWLGFHFARLCRLPFGRPGGGRSRDQRRSKDGQDLLHHGGTVAKRRFQQASLSG